MTKNLAKSAVLALISGLLATYAVDNAIFLLSWVCLIPLFIAFNHKTHKEFIALALFFSIGVSLVGTSWMITGAASFTDSSLLFGLLIFIVYILVSTLFWGLFFLIISWGQFLDRYSVVVRGLLLASVWVLYEVVKNAIFEGQPWFNYYTGTCLAQNTSAIQPVAFLGTPILTFVMILVNYMFAAFLMERKGKKLLIPLSIIIGYLGIGALMLHYFDNNLKPSGKPFKLAILVENLPPEVKWNDATGDALAGNFIKMSKLAVYSKSDMALWSESSIPWKYKPNDDLVHVILKISGPAGITNLIGINTGYSKKSLYNSIYCFLPDGSLSNRYDKSIALDFIEKPVAGFIIPFFIGEGCDVEEGRNPKPIVTPYGKAGVMICNESFIPEAATNMAKKGAEFFVNPSNDGWFMKFDVVTLHFYNAKLRAVETRKDIAINSNNGISGMIQASGRVTMSRKDKYPFVETVIVSPNKEVSVYTKYPYILAFLCGGILIGFFYFRIKPLKKKK